MNVYKIFKNILLASLVLGLKDINSANFFKKLMPEEARCPINKEENKQEVKAENAVKPEVEEIKVAKAKGESEKTKESVVKSEEDTNKDKTETEEPVKEPKTETKEFEEDSSTTENTPKIESTKIESSISETEAAQATNDKDTNSVNTTPEEAIEPEITEESTATTNTEKSIQSTTIANPEESTAAIEKDSYTTEIPTTTHEENELELQRLKLKLAQ